jgi:hypothetical protein
MQPLWDRRGRAPYRPLILRRACTPFEIAYMSVGTGTVVLYGTADGKVPPFNLEMLATNSFYVGCF